MLGRALWSSIHVSRAAKPGCAGHGRDPGGFGAGNGAVPGPCPARLGSAWVAAGAAGSPCSVRSCQDVPGLSFRRDLMGADGCQGNGGFGESGAPQPGPSSCWLPPGAASAAHAGAAPHAVPACSGGSAPLPSARPFSVLVSPHRGSSAGGLKVPSKGQRANRSSTGTAASGTFYLASGAWTMKGKRAFRGGCAREKEDVDFSSSC